MKNSTSNRSFWQLAPYSVFMLSKEQLSKPIPKKDLVLVNRDLLEKGISEMTLSVNRFAAIDDCGLEHLISGFNEQTLNLKGMQLGHYIKTKDILDLSPGEYATLRLYLDEYGKNNLSYSDGYTEDLEGLNYLDFEIENGLQINGKESFELILRFDLLPYTALSYFNPLRDFFKKQSMYANKLTRSSGS